MCISLKKKFIDMRKGNFLQVYLLNLLDIYAQLYANCIFLDIILLFVNRFSKFLQHILGQSQY